MREELLVYYERELTYLRTLGLEFAAKYPKVAGRLALEADGSTDPHVERLLEGVALLTARVRRKIDDELPELTDTVLGIVYPHFLAPIPSMVMVQLVRDPGQGAMTGPQVVPAGTTLTTKPVKNVRCRFRTTYPVTLWPIEVAAVSLDHPINVGPLQTPRAFRAESMLRLRLKTQGDIPFGTLAPSALRLHLHGELSLASGLYEMICGGPCQVELHAPGAEPKGLVLQQGAIRPVGFEADEALLPYPPHSFRAYTLLDEYFAFPEKFLSFDLCGLERAPAVGATTEVEVRIFSAKPPRFEQQVQAAAFRLGCTPAVNLFPKSAEPIRVDHTKSEYLIVPDVHGPEAHETYAVESVRSVGDRQGEDIEVPPLYSLRHGPRTGGPQVFWEARREQALDGATNVWLSLLDDRLRSMSPPVDTLSLQLLCTNRDLPASLPFTGTIGGDLDSEHIGAGVRILCLGKPTAARRRDPSRGAHWRLVSHLSLNYLSLVDHGREALQGILELYDTNGSASAKRQIAAITGVSSKRIVRSIRGAAARGLRVTIDFDREGFAGTTPYLLAAVLERFLGLYASINSFTELVARTPPDEEPLGTWPPRAGEQILL